ncbi:Xaa-Pro peptidase family protein [Vibrio gazogenes]|uniref:Xaa-Pro aminopeptidase n=1 Tax=Vibrio gazogenes DSM 21264 = NBRC 103151 TaxID=1123492 RepID=A0A1M5HFZ9_VIBGA|nr:Xaa-Pro peptidase family protein [Vibrio gazogenes]USP13588.1 Xaa-Pro peptidase family protein [Vibrio gazogenes]SHG14875.1 Xaa-Pro aminopeptidase [Vibrio gazogenes DSM 21264] [Vibrio gazogenes DSM 21264 = NBRC 103151]SJN55606.1 putative peptidase [Vibrio gazogenes]
MAYNLPQIDKLFSRMDIDLLIGTSKESIQYFSGFSPVIKTLNPYYGQCYVMLHRNAPDTIHIVHSIGEIDQILDADTPIHHVKTYGTFYRESIESVDLTQEEVKLQLLSQVERSHPSPAEAAKALIIELKKDIDIKRVGYDKDGMTLQSLQYLQQEFPELLWVEVSKQIRFSRQFKTSHEVELLTQSALINESAIYDTAAFAKIGVSETELAGRFNCALVQRGAFPSLTMLKIGRSAIGGQRRQRSDIYLQSGDLLWFDSDAIYQGFWSDIARVYSVGQPTPIIQKRYQALQNGMLAALDFIRPGLTGRDVYSRVMDVVHRSGFPEYNRHHVGHAIGLEPYETPILSPSDNNIIEEGMVLSVETPYYEFGIGALHIEDPLLVGSPHNQFLTANPAPDLVRL